MARLEIVTGASSRPSFLANLRACLAALDRRVATGKYGANAPYLSPSPYLSRPLYHDMKRLLSFSHLDRRSKRGRWPLPRRLVSALTPINLNGSERCCNTNPKRQRGV